MAAAVGGGCKEREKSFGKFSYGWNALLGLLGKLRKNVRNLLMLFLLVLGCLIYDM